MADYDAPFEYERRGEDYDSISTIHEGRQEIYEVDHDQFDNNHHQPENGYRSLTRFTGDIDPSLQEGNFEPRENQPNRLEQVGNGENGYRRSFDDMTQDRLREGTFDDNASNEESEVWEQDVKPAKRSRMDAKTCDNCRKRKVRLGRFSAYQDPIYPSTLILSSFRQ